MNDKFSNYFNQNNKMKKNIICILCGIIMFLSGTFIFNRIYSPKEIETLFMTYSYLSIVSYFGILLIVFSLNLKLIQSKIFFTIICILIFITVVYSNTPMMQLLFAICTVMAIVFTIILKKGFLIFVLACIYTLMALIVTINLFNSTLFNVLLNNNLYIVLYINIVLFMAIYYLTGVQACDKISKYFFSLDTISMEKKIDKNDLKNYVYFLYFLLYFSYYVYIFWTNASLSEENSILINALLITIIAMYQIEWNNIYNDIKDGCTNVKRLTRNQAIIQHKKTPSLYEFKQNYLLTKYFLIIIISLIILSFICAFLELKNQIIMSIFLSIASGLLTGLIILIYQIYSNKKKENMKKLYNSILNLKEIYQKKLDISDYINFDILEYDMIERTELYYCLPKAPDIMLYDCNNILKKSKNDLEFLKSYINNIYNLKIDLTDLENKINKAIKALEYYRIVDNYYPIIEDIDEFGHQVLSETQYTKSELYYKEKKITDKIFDKYLSQKWLNLLNEIYDESYKINALIKLQKEQIKEYYNNTKLF